MLIVMKTALDSVQLDLKKKKKNLRSKSAHVTVKMMFNSSHIVFFGTSKASSTLLIKIK